MSPGFTARPLGMFSVAPINPDHAHGGLELGQRADRLDHRGAAAHVELHLVHRRGRLERDAARVEGHRLADQREQGRNAAVAVADAVVVEADQPGRPRREPCATAANAPMPASRIAASPSTRCLEAEPAGELLGSRASADGGRSLAGVLPRSRARFWAPARIVAARDRLGDVVVGAERVAAAPEPRVLVRFGL